MVMHIHRHEPIKLWQSICSFSS